MVMRHFQARSLSNCIEMATIMNQKDCDNANGLWQEKHVNNRTLAGFYFRFVLFCCCCFTIIFIVYSLSCIEVFVCPWCDVAAAGDCVRFFEPILCFCCRVHWLHCYANILCLSPAKQWNMHSNNHFTKTKIEAKSSRAHECSHAINDFDWSIFVPVPIDSPFSCELLTQWRFYFRRKFRDSHFHIVYFWRQHKTLWHIK